MRGSVIKVRSVEEVTINEGKKERIKKEAKEIIKKD